MAFNPSSMSKVLVRATNWLGDAVMSLPAIRAIRQVFPHAHVAEMVTNKDQLRIGLRYP